MTVFDWIMENFGLAVSVLTIALNLILLGVWVVRTLRGDHATAPAKWLTLLEAARELEIEAEGFANYSAAEKLNYVLSRLRVLSCELEIPYEEERLTAAIEKDIAFSHAVNAGEKESDT